MLKEKTENFILLNWNYNKNNEENSMAHLIEVDGISAVIAFKNFIQSQIFVV